MNQKKRLIIVSPGQFGLNTDYVKYCQYLNSLYDISVLTIDEGRPKTSVAGVSVTYCPYLGSFRRLGYGVFLATVFFYLLLHPGIVMVTGGRSCGIYKRLMPWRKMIVNLRTVSIQNDEKSRKEENERLRRQTEPYDKIIMISEGGARQIGLMPGKTSIVSLGADMISTSDKHFESLDLLYVGTLHNRNIRTTLDGLKLFLDRHPDRCGIRYDIVGDGDEFELLKSRISEYGLENLVTLHGRKPYAELAPFMDRCNVGVSFVPMTPGYEYQPPTKTFEYCMSGMVCIATGTAANRQVVNARNGILIDDNAEAFAEGLARIYDNRNSYDSQVIRDTMRPYTWEKIIREQLLPVLQG